MKIIPAIIGEDFLDIESKIRQLEGLVEWAQIDVVDGEFAGPASWPYNQEDVDDEIRQFHDLSTKLNIELHLMVANPDDTLDEWIDTPLSRIFVHPEANKHAELDLTVLDMSKTESGIALKMDTPLDIVGKYVDRVDYVQLMSIRQLGNYGAEFDAEVLARIKEVKKNYPKIRINVDGGINESNMKLIKEAGADNAVVGSAIFGQRDINAAINKLKKLAA